MDRYVGYMWKRWLPKAIGVIRGEEIYNYYKTPKQAERAARAEKKRMENDKDIIMEI